MSRLVKSFAVPALALLVLAGCGSSKSSSTSSGSTSSSVPAPSANAAVAALVPAKYKSKGTLIVGSEAQYAPNEFIGPDGHTIIGMDADLVNAIAGVMGLKASFVNANFEAIIPGLAAGRYDLGASSFTDTKEREKTVDFVTYFSAGTSFYEKASGGPPITDLSSLCGTTVAVESGTTQEADAKGQSKKCTGGKSVKVLTFNDQSQANLAINADRAQVGMADSPVAAYQVKQSSGAFKLVGTPYGTAPYGIAIPQGNGMAKAVQAALKDLMSNGTYNQILTKWGIQSGAITDPVINGAIS